MTKKDKDKKEKRRERSPHATPVHIKKQDAEIKRREPEIEMHKETEIKKEIIEIKKELPQPRRATSFTSTFDGSSLSMSALSSSSPELRRKVSPFTTMINDSSSSEEEDDVEDKMDTSITVIIRNMHELGGRASSTDLLHIQERKRTNSFVRGDELSSPVMEDEEDARASMAVMGVLSSDVKTMQSLLDEKMVLVRALFDVPDWGEYTTVAGWVMTIFQAHTRSISLMQWSLKQEVQLSASLETLFREDTMPTALASWFLRSIGRTYLQKVIGPHIIKIVQTKHSYEIDLKRPGGAKSNAKRLRKFTSSVVKAIFDSVPLCPTGIRDFLYHMCNEIKDRYPASLVTKTVSSFFFLRFVCPGIVYPLSCGIITDATKQLTPQAQRCLVLTAKILQNLANGEVEFFENQSAKLKPLQDFSLPMQHFIESMCLRQNSSQISPISESAPTQQQYMHSLKELQKFMTQKLTDMPKCDASATSAEREQFQRLIKLRRALHTCSKTWANDPPSDGGLPRIPRFLSEPSNSNPPSVTLKRFSSCEVKSLGAS